MVIRELLAHIRPHRRILILGGLLGLVGSAAGLAMPLLAKYVVDAFGQNRSMAGPLLGLTVAVLVGAVVSALGTYLMERTGEGIVLGARRRLVDRMFRLKVADVDRLKPGDLLSRVTGDTTLLLVTLLVVVVIGGLTGLVMPRIQRAQKQAQEAVGEMGAVLDRALQAYRTVKASGAEEREIAVVAGAAERARDRGLQVAGWTSLAGVATWMTVQIAFLCVLAVGGSRVASGALEVSSLIAFLLYLFYLVAPIGQIVEGMVQLQQGLAAMKRIKEIEDLPAEPVSATVPAALGAGDPVGVRFEDVVFRYGDDRPTVHDGVSFEVPPGGLTALVGPSGAGKSTVFALLERFYEHQDGRITVDGRDIRDWPLAELRATLGYVEQDAPVLAGTLKENLLFAAQDATEEELRRAIVRTRLDDLVSRLPEGLDTAVGHRGVLLSGGERQRVAIARALLRKPRLLLLDEATSQLDAVNELRLREVIAEVAAETTVLVIAHRLSTVTNADRIVVMEAGGVRAVGTHAELVGEDDLYRELAATQFLVS